MKKTLTMGIVLVLLLACVGAVSANLVVNGNFEDPALGSDYSFNQGALPDWSVSGNIDLINTYHGWVAADGPQSIDLSGSERGTISQTIDTDAGKNYKLSFALAGNPECGETEKILKVSIDNNPVGTFPFTPTAMPGPGQWESKQITFKASSGTTKIAFEDVTTVGSVYCGVALDNIGVEEQANNVPVPEFPTMALPAALIVGLIGAVLFIQKSKED